MSISDDDKRGRSTRSGYTGALEIFQSLQKQLERTDDALESALRAYALAEQGYRGGLVDYLDVLNAQAELLAEQRARALIVAEQFLAHAGLMKALGGGYRAP
jgi:outer membrane protein TolC